MATAQTDTRGIHPGAYATSREPEAATPLARDPIHERCVPCCCQRLEALAQRLEAVTAAEPEFATIAEAAERLGIGIKALRSAVQRGEVLAYHLGTRAGGRPRVLVSEVRSWALRTAFDPFAEARASGGVAARRRAARSGPESPHGPRASLSRVPRDPCAPY